MYFTEQRSTMGLQWSSISLSLRTAITNSHQLGIRACLNVNMQKAEIPALLFALEKISTKKYHFIAQQRLKLRMPITNSHQLSICACLNVNSVHSEENLNSHYLDDDYVKHYQKTRHAKGKNISTSKLFALEKNSTKNAQTA